MTTGSIQTTLEEKRACARQSLAFNCKNPTFRKLFPDLVDRFESKASTSSADVDAGGVGDPQEEEEEGGESKVLGSKEAGPFRKEEEADRKKGAGGRGGLSVLMMASFIVVIILIITGGGW